MVERTVRRRGRLKGVSVFINFTKEKFLSYCQNLKGIRRKYTFTCYLET